MIKHLSIEQLEKIFAKRCERTQKKVQFDLQKQIMDMYQQQMAVIDLEIKTLGEFVDSDLSVEAVKLDFRKGTLEVPEKEKA